MMDMICVVVDRDSVCAGDSSDAHAATFEIGREDTVADLLAAAWLACPLASISGGKATWLIQLGSTDDQYIGVMAQQWQQPKLLIPAEMRAGDLCTGEIQSLQFRYWCQSDPDAVFTALSSGTTLPNR